MKDEPPIKLAKAVLCFLTNYHRELEAIVICLEYIDTTNLEGITKVSILTDSMPATQAIILTNQHNTLHLLTSEIKRIAHKLKTIKFSITSSHQNIKHNEEADCWQNDDAKLAKKHLVVTHLTLSTTKAINKIHCIDTLVTR